MKKTLIFLFSFAGLLFMILSCSKNDSNDEKPIDNYDFTDIIASFTDDVVVKDYADMKNASEELYDNVDAFIQTGSQSDLDASCASWRKTRIYYESGEAFIFGPATFETLDPMLDSWPLDQSQLQQVIDSKLELTADKVRNGLGYTLRGFHTIEFLIFRDGNPRNAANVTAREKEYLLAVTQVLRDDCIKLWALWHGEEGISGLEKEVLAELEVEPGEGFAKEFKNAGKAGSRYASQKDAIDEIINGCSDIADEVANAKIAEPFDSKDPMKVESQFSWNSLTDFHNNIVGIRNSFFGGNHTLASFLDKKDATLVPELEAKIKAATDAIDAIPFPFRNNLNRTTEIQSAMNAVNDLKDFLDKKVNSLIN
jgi:predicted lipoprotein